MIIITSVILKWTHTGLWFRALDGDGGGCWGSLAVDFLYRIASVSFLLASIQNMVRYKGENGLDIVVSMRLYNKLKLKWCVGIINLKRPTKLNIDNHNERNENS